MGTMNAVKVDNILNKLKTTVPMLQGLHAICATQVDKVFDILRHIGLVLVVRVPELLDLQCGPLNHAGELWN